jgi:hypothetical protein
MRTVRRQRLLYRKLNPLSDSRDFKTRKSRKEIQREKEMKNEMNDPVQFVKGEVKGEGRLSLK